MTHHNKIFIDTLEYPFDEKIKHHILDKYDYSYFKTLSINGSTTFNDLALQFSILFHEIETSNKNEFDKLKDIIIILSHYELEITFNIINSFGISFIEYLCKYENIPRNNIYILHGNMVNFLDLMI